MKPLETVGQVTTRDGQDLVLYRRDGAFQIRVDGLELERRQLDRVDGPVVAFIDDPGSARVAERASVMTYWISGSPTSTASTSAKSSGRAQTSRS